MSSEEEQERIRLEDEKNPKKSDQVALPRCILAHYANNTPIVTGKGRGGSRTAPICTPYLGEKSQINKFRTTPQKAALFIYIAASK